jgi:hypothetical protein
VLGGEVHGSDAAVARGQRLHVRDRLGAVEAGPGRQARAVAGSAQPSRDATAAPSASTSAAVDRHPYQGNGRQPAVGLAVDNPRNARSRRTRAGLLTAWSLLEELLVDRG